MYNPGTFQTALSVLFWFQFAGFLRESTQFCIALDLLELSPIDFQN